MADGDDEHQRPSELHHSREPVGGRGQHDDFAVPDRHRTSGPAPGDRGASLGSPLMIAD